MLDVTQYPVLVLLITGLARRYLAHKEPPPPRTLQQACTHCPTVILGGSYNRVASVGD